jgi:hypothetical protein
VDPDEVYYLEVLPVSRGLLGNLWNAFGSD